MPATEDGGAWVGNPFPGDVRGAAVNRLEHRCTSHANIGRRRQPQTTGQTGGQVAEDIAKQIGRHQHVETAGILRQLQRGGINQQLIDRKSG